LQLTNSSLALFPGPTRLGPGNEANSSPIIIQAETHSLIYFDVIDLL